MRTQGCLEGSPRQSKNPPTASSGSKSGPGHREEGQVLMFSLHLPTHPSIESIAGRSPGPQVPVSVCLPRQNIGSLSRTGHLCVAADLGTEPGGSRPSINICRLSAGTRPDLGQLRHRPATSRPAATFQSWMPQAECDFYQWWVRKTPSPWSPTGGKEPRWVSGRPPGHREGLCLNIADLAFLET